MNTNDVQNKYIKKEEYEVISHNSANFKVFLVNLLYRAPHSHKDFEIGLILEGIVDIITTDKKEHFSKNDIFLMNPYQAHELITNEPALILSIQVPPKFFEVYYPRMTYTSFVPFKLSNNSVANTKEIQSLILDIAREYFIRNKYYEFKCAILINQLFYNFLNNVELTISSEQELKIKKEKGKRARRIMHYIDAHYTEKILLSDIASEEDLDLYYLSHFFKDSFGVSFQTYVNKLRCEHARHLLLVTDHSLLDICMECGFSDPKYFNKSFNELYGCTPKQYRKNFENLDLHKQQKSMLSTQEFLSDEASILTLHI